MICTNFVVAVFLALCAGPLSSSSGCDQETEVCVDVDQSLTFPEPVNTETKMTVQASADFGGLNAYLKGIVAGFFDFVFPAGIPWGTFLKFFGMYY